MLTNDVAIAQLDSFLNAYPWRSGRDRSMAIRFLGQLDGRSSYRSCHAPIDSANAFRRLAEHYSRLTGQAHPACWTKEKLWQTARDGFAREKALGKFSLKALRTEDALFKGVLLGLATSLKAQGFISSVLYSDVKAYCLTQKEACS